MGVLLAFLFDILSEVGNVSNSPSVNLKKWIPSLKKQSFAFIACLKPHIQSIATNTVDVYHSSKRSIAPLVFKVQKLADPYIQVSPS